MIGISGAVAKAIAITAHAGQLDKGGKPYFDHVERVSRLAEGLAFEHGCGIALTDTIAIAGLLHDVVEDTPMTLGDLVACGIPGEVVDIVRIVSRDKSTGESYQNWIRSIAESGNVGAILVKLADNLDNSSPVRIAQLPESEQSIAGRYARARKTLQAALTPPLTL